MSDLRDVFVESLAYQHPRYITGGESKKDHGATPEEWEKGGEGRTLCGRPLGRWYFPRQERFTGHYSFHCSQCVKAGVRIGYLDPERLADKFKPEPSA